ncbi:prolipoprotein diacylglyceryl transferase [bacterium]|nr:prolipoprotein diacylglyceryl transferase [bacterium]
MYPIIFKIGPLAVRSWGTMLLIGFILGYWLAIKRAEKYSISKSAILDLALYLLLAGIIGGRFVYVLLNLRFYFHNPIQIIAIWNGGLSFYGSLGAGVLTAIIFARRRNVNFWQLADLLTPSLTLGYAFGRIGCFLNGCCYGVPTSLPIGVKFPTVFPPEPRHPVQLYAFAANILFMFLLLWYDKRKSAAGQTFALYMMLYAFYRSLAEILRKGATAEILLDGITQGQMASLVLFIIGVCLWLRLKREKT